jgi:hypothetical protein
MSNIFEEKPHLFEAVYRMNEVKMTQLVPAAIKYFNRGEDDLLTFLKSQFSIAGDRANFGQQGLMDDWPTNNRNIPQDPVSKFVLLTAIRQGNPQAVLNFFKKYQKALNLKINFAAIEEFIKNM